MPKTLLAVDDSVTMRKVVEMTFAGEDMRVVAVATADEALAFARKEKPDLVFADISLDGHSGYDLCKSLKDEHKTIPVVILSSKQNPFDAAKGQAAGADDHIDKPYDTTKTIELVKAVLSRGKSVAPSAVAATPNPAIPAPPKTPQVTPAIEKKPTAAQGAAAVAKVAAQPAPKAAAPSPVAPPVAAKPAPAEVQHGTLAELAQVPAPAASASSIGNADFMAKLQGLGLTAAQVEAVLALSREIVERVVWEVVPVLAETMVKEEIARLMKS